MTSFRCCNAKRSAPSWSRQGTSLERLDEAGYVADKPDSFKVKPLYGASWMDPKDILTNPHKDKPLICGYNAKTGTFYAMPNKIKKP